jgi:hypothetical protein
MLVLLLSHAQAIAAVCKALCLYSACTSRLLVKHMMLLLLALVLLVCVLLMLVLLVFVLLVIHLTAFTDGNACHAPRTCCESTLLVLHVVLITPRFKV